MIWYITVLDSDGKTVLFARKSTDRAEIEAGAAEARRLRPRSQILIWSVEPPSKIALLYTWRKNRLWTRKDIGKKTPKPPQTLDEWLALGIDPREGEEDPNFEDQKND